MTGLFTEKIARSWRITGLSGRLLLCVKIVTLTQQFVTVLSVAQFACDFVGVIGSLWLPFASRHGLPQENGNHTASCD
ncbi:MAG: hypothetical protein Q7T07_05815 [Burkholderiaceae bacterium]|nr:hypothetical protein [Burkholderiaceae bacterium]